MKLIKLEVPTCLSMGSKPISQISAVYHYTMSEGSYSLQSYASEFGWTLIETKQFIEYMSQWHDLCNINYNSVPSHNSIVGSDIVVVGLNNNKSISNNNNTTTTTKEKIIKLLGKEYPVVNCDDNLYRYFISNSKCFDLLEYWLELYRKFQGDLETIQGKFLSPISVIIRQNNDDKARLIINWAFNCEDGKASFLRKNNYMFPSSLLSKGSFPENYNLAKVWKEQEKDRPASNSFHAIPEFDSDGNLITTKGDK